MTDPAGGRRQDAREPWEDLADRAEHLGMPAKRENRPGDANGIRSVSALGGRQEKKQQLRPAGEEEDDREQPLYGPQRTGLMPPLPFLLAGR